MKRSTRIPRRGFRGCVRLGLCLTVTVLIPLLSGCGDNNISSHEESLSCYDLGGKAGGCLESIDNIENLTVVSNNENVLEAEYDAGFVQGKLQREAIIAARDNTWDNNYVTDPAHSFPKQLPPSGDEYSKMGEVLKGNYAYTIDYIQKVEDPVLAQRMQRLIFRLLGIYHGTGRDSPAPLDFSGSWLPSLDYFQPSEVALGYETPYLTFMDLYLVNGNSDAVDVIADLIDSPWPRPKCSAFVKKTSSDTFITHNTWSGFLSQTMAQNLYVNGDFITFNAGSPGLIGSATDFGYNNKGIMFNETTHHATYTVPAVNALWMFVRAALAEQFADSLDAFFTLVSLEASGTYMNGYMLVDANSKEIGLVEMSYRTFVFFKSDENGGYHVVTKPEGRSTDYDAELIHGDYILGINYPVSIQVRDDLQAVDTRPARRTQLLAGIGAVTDIESAKALITYTDPQNPLSIFGRWDLGYGETPTPKTIPDGAIDAKAVAASMISYVGDLKGVLEPDSPYQGFWMKFGTPYVDGKPFIWSQSQWSGQKLRDVPDVLDGDYHLLNVYIR